MDGTHLINQLQNYIPNLLVNWVKITDSKQAIYASTAALSWSELFPASIPMSTITEAEKLFSKTAKNVDEFEECLSLFDSILLWAKGHDMGENLRMKWIEDQLIGYDTTYLFMAGLSGSGKSSFVNFVLGEKIMDQAPTSSVVLFKNADKMEISEITDEEVIGLSSITDFQERMERRRNALDSIIEFKQPNLFLKENKLAFIDSPGLTVNPHESSDVLKYLSIADSILFVLEATAPFTDKDRTVLSYLQTEAPGTQVHFLLNKMDLLKNEEEAIRVYDKTKGIIQSYLPEAKIFAFSSNYERIGQQNDLGEFIKSLNIVKNIQDKRMGKLLSFIRSTITMFLKKRIDVENGLIESVRWNEDIVQKFNGALNQLSDLEGQKSKVITRSYHSIKESMQKEISVSIPKLLRECAQFIKEDSNFSQIHFELNAEMNKRLQEYLDNTVMTRFLQSLEEWINQAKNEFDEGQSFLNEMADGFNVLYGEERMILECDFKVLDDWRRDKDRMTSRFQLEPINILLRRTPSQLLLKSAGKLFEALSQNKAMLFNKYKQFVETEDYSEAAAIVAKQFFQQFELFEKSLERDVTMFFKNPGNELKKAAVEASAEINANQETLKKLNTNPELYRDPLTLFEVKLRQFEWMTVSGKNVHHTV
jgi:GTP-binding protein EngB required for normal cell division